MKRLATMTAAVALLIGAVPAGAADIYKSGGLKDGGSAPLRAAHNWAGFYLGGNLGYGWAGSRGVTDAGAYFENAEFPFTAVTAAVTQPSMDGVIGGVHIGANVQQGIFVGGIVADIHGSGMSGAADTSADVSYDGQGNGDPFPFTHKQSIDWFGTVRGKLGIAVEHVLFYGTGGFAYGHVEDKLGTAFTGDGGPNYSVTNGAWRSGYAVGGGVEYGLGRWSLGAEYLYVDLGSASVSKDVDLGSDIIAHIKTGEIPSDFHTIRATLSYHLN